MSRGGKSRSDTRLPARPAWELDSGKLHAFLGRWYGRAGEAWVTVRKLAELAAQSPAVIAYVEDGQGARARTRRMACVLYVLVGRPLRVGGTAYRLEREKYRTEQHKPRWRLVCAAPEDSGEGMAP